MAESCADCRFSAPGKHPVKLDCRRYPPVDIARHNAAEWPAVFPDAWCGEYESKPTKARKRPTTGERETREQG